MYKGYGIRTKNPECPLLATTFNSSNNLGLLIDKINSIIICKYKPNSYVLYWLHCTLMVLLCVLLLIKLKPYTKSISLTSRNEFWLTSFVVYSIVPTSRCIELWSSLVFKWGWNQMCCWFQVPLNTQTSSWSKFNSGDDCINCKTYQRQPHSVSLKEVSKMLPVYRFSIQKRQYQTLSERTLSLSPSCHWTVVRLYTML